MGLFDFLKKKTTPVGDTGNPPTTNPIVNFDKMIERALSEYLLLSSYIYSLKANDSKVFTEEILMFSTEQKTLFITDAIRQIHKFFKGRPSYSSSDKDYQLNIVRDTFFRHLFRGKMDLNEAQIIDIYAAMSSMGRYSHSTSIMQWPIMQLVGIIEKNTIDGPLSVNIVSLLKDLHSRLEKDTDIYIVKERVKLYDKINAMLFKVSAAPASVPPSWFIEDTFGTYANEQINSVGEDDRQIWFGLIDICKKATGAKPAKKNLEAGTALLKTLGSDKFKKTVNLWIDFLNKLKEKEHSSVHTYGGREYTNVYYEFISAPNCDTLKGFIWLCVNFHDKATLFNIASLAERSYRKIPGKGPAAASLGNACLYVLSETRGLDGIGHLSRLKLRIKQNNTRKTIDAYLSAAAKNLGITIAEIEDLASDDFGLTEGKKELEFGEVKANISIAGIGSTDVQWFNNGVQQKSVPKVVKDKYADKLKKIKLLTKQIEVATTAQRDRVDRMLKMDRKLSWEKFDEFYFSHGLMSFIAKKLVWSFTENGKTVNAIWAYDAWRNNNDESISFDKVQVVVTLWHPVHNTVDDIKQWRAYLIQRSLSQPVKQVFREVYFLTDAEINTRSYSNRMAAHILKQHQFSSLANIRGWRYSLMGAYDDGRNNGATSISIPEFGIRAEFWVNEVNADGAFNDTGIWNFISTDQVRFVSESTNAPMLLVDVPKVIFSEIFRDVDLFVGVASVGNDPAWSDNGGLPAYRNYWESYSFGDLSDIANTRKAVLERILPKLKIAPVSSIHDKFLVVKGTLRTYKIHIGSTNILMEPNDQYLCIVPDRGKPRNDNVFLPFDGDSGLSVIISKAFLLAEDDKITDTTITSQINRR